MMDALSPYLVDVVLRRLRALECERCAPVSTRRLAVECGVCERHALRWLHALEEHGLAARRGGSHGSAVKGWEAARYEAEVRKARCGLVVQFVLPGCDVRTGRKFVLQ